MQTVSLGDYFPDDRESELERAKKLLEEKDFYNLIQKQGKARREIAHDTNFCSGFQLDEYQDDVIVYLEVCEGQKYKVGRLEEEGLDFDCENPEPIEL